MTLTGIKDIDLQIILYLDDKDLFNMNRVNLYMKSLCDNENLWRKKFMIRFGKYFNDDQILLNEMREKITWKNYYKDATIIYRELLTDYNSMVFEQEDEDLDKMLSTSYHLKNHLIVCNKGYISLVKTVVENTTKALRHLDLAEYTEFSSDYNDKVSPEIVFDQTLGSLFVVRVAGNIVDDFAIGSIEYGVKVLGANTILVLGHSSCGAVEAALKGMKFDNHIQSVLTAIQPAVEATKNDVENRLEKATKANVRNVEEKLKKSKPVLADLIEKKTLQVIGGYYNLDSGKVEFFDKP